MFKALSLGKGRKTPEACANTWNKSFSGKQAFLRESNGYKVGEINNKPVKAHRAAWAFVYGEWPKMQIDHVDRCKTNNKICNLRHVTPQQNLWNSDAGRKKHKLIGAYFDKRRGTWFTYVRINGRKVYRGPFCSEKMANQAYLALIAKFRN